MPHLHWGELVFPGHIGTIYQASHAEYLGRTTSRRILLLPDGRELNERALSNLRGDAGHAYVEQEVIKAGAPLRRRRGKDAAPWLAEGCEQSPVVPASRTSPQLAAVIWSRGSGGEAGPRGVVGSGAPRPQLPRKQPPHFRQYLV